MSANSAHAQWILTNGPMGGAIRSFAVSGTNLLAATENDGIWLTTDDGSTWNPVNNGITNTNARALAVGTTYIFAGTNGGVFRSSNNGSSWSSVNSGLTNTTINTIFVSGSTLFAGTEGGGIFRSSNNGSSWSAVNTGLTDHYIHSFTKSGTIILAGTEEGVVRSTDNGTTWSGSGLTGKNIYSLIEISSSGTSYIFAGTLSNGVFYSINDGTSWSDCSTGLTNPNVSALASTGTNVFAGTLGTSAGVYLSNLGLSWDSVNSGLDPNAHIYSIIIKNGFIFAGTNGNGAWRRMLSDFGIVSVDLWLDEFPKEFNLAPNYPNPFNSITRIKYNLPENSDVHISIYDMLGRQVRTLVNQSQEAGYRTIIWNGMDDNGSPVSTGLYLYMIKAGDFSQTRKMLLLK